MSEFSEFFESDGRHHLWLANADYGTIVYDRHNFLYGYGPLDCFEDVANAHGLRNEPFEVPAPHWHAYHPEYDVMQQRLLTRWDWVEKPLRPEDEA